MSTKFFRENIFSEKYKKKKKKKKRKRKKIQTKSHLLQWWFTLSWLQVNPSPAEPRYALPLQTVQIQISWLLQLIWIWTVCHSVCEFVEKIRIKYSDWLKIKRWAWFLNLFSMTRVNLNMQCLDRLQGSQTNLFTITVYPYILGCTFSPWSSCC